MAAAGGVWFARASAPVNGPIVLVSVDALRADRLPAYGYRGVRTPAIDALAADGIVFERAYSHVPQTLPAHASLLTGRLPFEHGVRDGAGFSLKSAERTLAEMLADRGYATAGVVSSYLLRKDSGIAQGFSFFDAEMSIGLAEAPSLLRESQATEKMAEHWLDSSGTSRAFLFMHLSELHRPYDDVEAATAAAHYDERLAHEDAAVGALVRYLKSHQLYDRSTIVLVADHGEGLGDHGESAHGLLTYEEALRVPLIVKLPAAEQAGRRVKDPVQHIDIVPTILDLAKAPTPGSLRGRSLTPLFSGNSRSSSPIYSESLYGHYHFGWAEIASVTDGRYRYIDAPQPELYDLETDPQQRQNIVGSHADVTRTLSAALKDIATPAPAARPEPTTAAIRARLEAFGYVGVSDGLPAAETPNPIDLVDVVERYRLAAEASASGHWEQALEHYRGLAQAQPEMVDVWMHVGDTAMRLEKPDVAATAFLRAAERAPLMSDAHLGAAFASLRLRKLDDARAQAQAVLDIPAAAASEQSSAHEVIARVALSRRDYDLARAEAALALKADPSRPVDALVEGRAAFDHKHYAEAIDPLQAALVKAEATPDLLFRDLRLLTGDALVALQRYSEAEYLFLEELKLAPKSVRARAGLTAVYRATGRTAEAAALAH